MIKFGAGFAVFGLIFAVQAQACILLGSDLCSISCRGEIEKITAARVSEASPSEKSCALSLAENVGMLKQLLENGVDVNSASTIRYSHSPAGRNALFRVIQDGRMDLFTALIENKIDVNHQDARGATPLIAAVWADREQMVTDLLKAGALPNLQDEFGMTALCHTQQKLFKSNAAIVSALEKAGAICAK